MSRCDWATPLSLAFLEKDYLLPGQSLDERVDRICRTAEGLLGYPGFADRFRDNLERGWYSLATPVWTNFGTDRGLPISCFGCHIDDTMGSILGTVAEVGMMTKMGGGTAAYFGDLRGRGAAVRHNGQSAGSVHFAQLFDSLMAVVSQGSTRRGNFAGYWPVDHPDIDEVLGIKTEGHPVQGISYGVCVPDGWLEAMVAGDQAKRRTWAKVLAARANTGFPYLFFTDTVNRGAPDCYRDRGMAIRHSQLCSEVCLPTGDDESFVCCLSSMNALHFDAWRGTDAPGLLAYFLDAVMEEFIRKAADVPFMGRAVRFARRHRALGIGILGWHSYLQEKMVPFESAEAKRLNAAVARSVQDGAWAASREMAGRYGEPEVLEGYGRRNTTLTAVAPTKSSSFILGQVSEGIEPHRSNYIIKDLAKGKFSIKNQSLERVLRSKGADTPGVWDSVLKNGGSVQHLDCLTGHEKAVFRTFAEISPMEVVRQAAQRQRWVDQSQSLNIMVHPSVATRDVNALVLEAWRCGVKTLYYQHSVSAAQEFARDILSCSTCEA